MNRRIALVAGVIGLLLVPMPAMAAVLGSPDISARFSDNTLTPGETGSLDLVLLNSGDLENAGSSAALNGEVQTARGLTVALENESAPIDIQTGRQAIGTVPTGASSPIAFEVAVPTDAEPGTYDVEIDIDYEYTSYISETDGTRDEEEASRTITRSIHIESVPQLEVQSVDSNARVGSTGTVEVTVRNNGTRTARDATLTLASPSQSVTFGGEASADRYVGTWAPGETRTLTYRVAATESADSSEYAFTLSGEYERANGEQRSIDAVTVPITPAPEQSFSVVGTTSDVAVGASGTYNVTLRNTGPTAVTDATVQLQSPNAAITFGGTASATRYVGEWGVGETRTVSVDAAASEGAQRQQYSLSASVSYEDDEGDTGQVGGLSVALVPDREHEFTVVATEESVPIDDRGTYNVTLRNDGPAVRDATVQLTSPNPDITFGQSSSATRYVGAWDANETRTVSFEASASENAQQRSYALTASVAYEDQSGNAGSDGGLSVGLVPEPEQTFALENVEGSLQVGDEGRLQGTIVNTGPRAVEDVVLRWTSDQQNVNPTETEYSVGRLESGESVPFNFSVEISDGAESGPRQFSLTAQYQNRNGNQRTSDTLNVRQRVAPGSDEFDLSVANATIAPGGSSTIEVTVRNTEDRTLTDISAMLFTDDPISASDDEAYVSRLEPGESTTITFGIGASGAALTKSYPLSMDFQYDEPDGDTITSDTYRVAVTVERSSGGGGGGSTLVLVGAVVVVAVAAVLAYRRFN